LKEEQIMRVLLRLDADRTVGFGHAVRCSALIQAFPSDIDLVVAGDDPQAIRSVFPTARYRSVKADGFETILAAEAADVVIVDLPHTTPDLWASARASGAIVVAVDDEGGAISADFVINGAGPESVHHYPALGPNDRALTGPAYALLRPAFAKTRWAQPNDRSLSIVVGSGVRARDWALDLARDGLKSLNLSKMKMVVGGFFSAYPELRALCDDVGIQLFQALGPEELAQFLASSQVALITGGMVMPETLAVGTPAVVFPQVENLIPETRWFSERNAIIDLGFEGGFQLDFVFSALDRMISDQSAAQVQSQRGRALVDGMGAHRCAAAVLASVKA
jgi:UDP-2,4-diacetamido-2,4,6-trideoxy-beta-L-altropyranose hydrolase